MSKQITDAEKIVFFSEMKNLSELYKSIKHLILLSEYYNSNQGVVVSTINELRNSFDHVMRSLFDPAKTAEELFKAKGHLYRAAYDACEIIVIDRLEYINAFKDSVGFSALYKSYPDYYTEVLPEISVVKEDLAEIRENPDTAKRIRCYEQTIEKLIKICNNLDKIAPAIDKQNKKQKRTAFFTTSMVSSMLGLSAVFFLIFNLYLHVNTPLSILFSILISLSYPLVVYLFKRKTNERID